MNQFLITNKRVISFEEFHYSFNFGKINHSGSISGDEIILCADWKKITIDQAKGSLSIEKTDWQYHKTPIASPQAYQLIFWIFHRKSNSSMRNATKINLRNKMNFCGKADGFNYFLP